MSKDDELHMMTTLDVLREFVEDVEAVGKDDPVGALKTPHEQGGLDWPDLADTYLRAKKILARDARMTTRSKHPLKIKEVIKEGVLSASRIGDVAELLRVMGRLLDKSSANDIFGELIFRLEDDTLWVATVEGVLSPVTEGYLKERYGDNEADEGKTFFVNLDTIITVDGPGHGKVEATTEAEAIEVAKQKLRNRLAQTPDDLQWLVDKEEG